MIGFFLGGLLLISQADPTGSITPGERMDMVDAERAWQPKLPKNHDYLGVTKDDVTKKDISDDVFITMGDTTLLLAVSILAEYKGLAIDVSSDVNINKKLYQVSFEAISWKEAVKSLSDMAGVSIYPNMSAESLQVSVRGKLDE